jgi:hypothetical protein
MNARLTTVATIENWKCGMWNDDSKIIIIMIIIPNTVLQSTVPECTRRFNAFVRAIYHIRLPILVL